MKNVLLVMLEFDNWNQARAWSYTGAWAFQDGLEENGHRCTVLPAMWGRAPDAADSFIHHAEKLLAGQSFDEAWVWCVHTQFDERFWQWLARVAPRRIGITMESLGVNTAEAAEFPHFAQRQEEVLAQLAHCTHAIVADEADIDLVQQRLGIPASWNVVMVPERFVRFDTAPECPQAAFIGNKYGERRPYLEDPALAELLCRPHLPERDSDLPQRFDALHQEIRRLLLAGQFDHALLQRATLQMKLVREALFRLHLDGIRLGFANINLPSMLKAYAGRVTESMAAATPAISWLPADRPACARLFEAGKEIELFSSPAELQNLLTRQAPDSAQRNRQVTAARNTLLNRHTTRIRLRQYLNWLDQGVAPDFFSDIGYKPSVEESQYYKHFFAEDPHWSRPTPNGDERARWEKIQTMVARAREAQGDPLRIVEVGCGRGWLSKLLSEYGAVLGSEPVGDVINHAKGMFPEQEFFTGSAELLQFIGLKEFFDLLVCSEVIEHVPYAYKEGFVAGLASLVRPGGYLILTTPRADIYPEWSEKYGKPPQPTEDWLTEAQLKTLLEGAGCEALELQRAFLMDIYQIWLFQRKVEQDPVIIIPEALETTLARMLGDAWQLATGQSGTQAIGDALSCLKEEAVRSKEDLAALAEWATRNAQTPVTELQLPDFMQRAFSRLCTAAGKGLDASALHALIPANTFNQAWPSRVPHMRKLMTESFNGPIQALEIGAWFGHGSTRVWLETLPAGSTLTIVDGWRSYLSAHDLKAGANIYRMMDDLAPAAFASTIRTVYEFERKRPDIQIILIRANAGTVLPKFSAQQFDFIYIDGSHYYKEAREDIALCKSLLKSDGIMCGDDLELSPTPELLALAAAHDDTDFITLPDGRGFHPGVMRAVHEEAPGFTMRSGFWWARKPAGPNEEARAAGSPIRSSTPLLEICIPTWNRAPRLAHLLATLGPAAEKHGILVSVSDNASDDNTQVVLDTYAQALWLRRQRHAQNLGFDGNIDSLITVATGDYLWFQGDDDHIVVEALPALLEALARKPAAVWTNIEPVGAATVSAQRNLQNEHSASFESLTSRFGLLGCFGGLAHTICRRDRLQAVSRRAFLGSNYCHVFSFAQALATQTITLLHTPLTQVFPASAEDSARYVERWAMSNAGPWDFAVMRQAELFAAWLAVPANAATAPGCFRMYCGMHFPYQLLCLKALANLLFSGQALPESSLAAVKTLCQALPQPLFAELCAQAIHIAAHKDEAAVAAWWQGYRVAGQSNWMSQ